MTPREEHLSEMLERALALIDEQRVQNQEAYATASALAAVEARLGRIEVALLGLKAIAQYPSAESQGPIPNCDAEILKALEHKPLKAVWVARAVFGQVPTKSQVQHVWRSLGRLTAEGYLARAGFKYQLAREKGKD